MIERETGRSAREDSFAARTGMLLWLAVLGLVCEPGVAHGQRLPTRVYSTAQGLTHPIVLCIVRDSRGFLWFCTREGLARFDGHEFTNFRTEHGLPTGVVSGLLETREGMYWVATMDGLVRFDPGGRTKTAGDRGPSFKTYRLGGDERAAAVSALAEDASGSLWMGSRAGLFQVHDDPDGVRLSAFDLGVPDRLQDRAVTALLADRAGSLWVANGAGVFRILRDGRISQLVQGDKERVVVHSLLEDREGLIWAGTESGLWRMGVDEKGHPLVVNRYRSGPEEPIGFVLSLAQTGDGALWAGTTEGVVRFTPREGSTKIELQRFEEGRGMPGGEVGALAEDRSGNLWIGTGYGAVKLSRSGFVTFGAAEGLGWATGITETDDGALALVGGVGDDWALYCHREGRLERVELRGVPGIHSWAWNQILLEDDLGEWWLGATEGLFRFPASSCEGLGESRPIERYDSERARLAADVVIRLFEDPRGDLWIATVGHAVRPDGLSLWSRETGSMRRFGDNDGLPTFERHFVSAFAADSAGSVWIGFSGNGGLARYRHGRFERFTTEDGLPAGQIRNLLVDDRGRLWLASYRGGLGRVDDPTVDKPAFEVYTTAEGLSGNETHAVVSDRSGLLYVGTAHGIDRVDPETGWITHFGASDGLPAGEMNAAIRDRNGTLWFTYTTGLVHFVPSSGETGAPPPPALITGVRVEGLELPISAVGETEVPAVTLPASRRTLQIDFVALDFGPGERLRYQYRLEGASSEWSSPLDERNVIFANLSPGSYRFQVRAVGPGEVVSKQPASFAFSILPPIWRRTWFVALAAVTLALAAYAFHRYRLRRLLQIAHLRTRIATDLHDDLGANLTRIAVLGEVARRQGSGSEGALTSITRLARESIDSMSSLVWAIDPARERLDDLIRKMREHAEETFALDDTELRFLTPEEAGDQRLDIDVRHDAFLIFKEAVNNVARHSGCREVVVSIGVERSMLVIEVSDDGVGFDLTGESEGQGMFSMRRRAERIGGILSVESMHERGTSVRLSLPLGHGLGAGGATWRGR